MLVYNHPFHMVTISPWPLLMSLNIMNLLTSIVIWMFMFNKILMLMNLLILIISLYQWWRDVIRESTYQGFHTNIILKFMKFSMILFIISELFFFISFFWTYFHSAISVDVEIGSLWPPKMIILFNPYDIPLLNSIILISSGFTVTWSHYCLLKNNFKDFKNSLSMTILLSLYFLFLQYVEYNESFFCFNDGIYGSIFFMTTGFHGLHVMIGMLMLLICWGRSMFNHFSNIHHFHFELALWYWHFVDIIWLFLYLFIYWWMF